VWCALKHPNIADFLGLSYEVPFPAAIILPYYSKGNSLDFIKREENANVFKLVRLLFLLPRMYTDFYARNKVKGAAEGLKYLHQQSPPIVHADIRAVRTI
jgi:serine/threonine protein kinase